MTCPPVPVGELSKTLQLKRLSPAGPAGLLVTSLPIPRGMSADVQIKDRPTAAKPLGQWWNTKDKAPRRVILAADGGDAAPDTLNIAPAGKAAKGTLPTVSDPIFAQSQEPEIHWERRSLAIEWQGKRVEIAMGMRVGGDIRWWEHCRLVKLSESDTFIEVEMAGSIPHIMFNKQVLHSYTGYAFPGLHQHHWLSGHVYARLHANGVCEIYAHHINSRFVDDGLQLDDAVPTIGFRCSNAASNVAPKGDWDGSLTDWNLDGVQIDFKDVANMASKEQPGNVEHDGEFLVVQPYQGMELFGGLCPLQLTGDPFIFHAKDHTIGRGMARTLRFSLSLNPKRSAHIARYIAPAWWYGLAQEFSPEPYLPVSDELDKMILSGQNFLRDHMIRNAFEDGSLPRGVGKDNMEKMGKHEPGWEGEAAGAAFLLAYRTGSAEDYGDAMRACYCFTDLYLDHASKIGRMHGYAPNGLNVPMTRLQAPIFAWLETGDQYALNIARACLDGTYWTHKNSWPRVAVGRDACFVRGAMMLYKYTNETRSLEIAREVIKDTVISQNPTGWFGDQGGGSGIHGWGSYIAKPWMGLMAVGGMLDYLEIDIEENQPALDSVKKFADWLMAERFDHDGVMGWSYQHLFNDTRKFRFAQNGETTILPTAGLWHMDYLARLMAFCTTKFNDTSYYDAWLESYRANPERKIGGDHSFAQSIQYLPWTQAMTWRASWKDGKVVADPMPLTANAPQEGTVMGPEGPVKISR